VSSERKGGLRPKAGKYQVTMRVKDVRGQTGEILAVHRRNGVVQEVRVFYDELRAARWVNASEVIPEKVAMPRKT
jgi:hypothetical protein